MADENFPHGNHEPPTYTRGGVEADGVQLSEGELDGVDENWGPPKTPYPKVAAAGAAGALATLIVAVLALAGVVVPETLAAALATVLAFAAGYQKTE